MYKISKKVSFISLALVVVFIISIILISNVIKHNNSIIMLKTDEINYEKGQASSIILQQDSLFEQSDLIFDGYYLKNEYYTLKNKENGTEEYFTYYYFLIEKVYFGDKELEGKEIPLLARNFNMQSEVILSSNKYTIFSRIFNDPIFKQANDSIFYTTSITQAVFENIDDNVIVTKELLGYCDFENEITKETHEFTNKWISDYINIEAHNLSPEQMKIEVDLNDNITYDFIKSRLNINEYAIKSNEESIYRLSVPNNIFNHFLEKAITFYKK